MRLTSITITDLAGFHGEVSFKLPAVSLIEGPHGAGKSSLERILMYLLGRRPLAQKGSRSVQHDPGMLHTGAESGSAVITFDEEIDFLRVVVKPDATRRDVKMRGAKKWEDASGMIDDITNALAYNPMAFRDLNEKERLEAFLRVVPVEITPSEVADAVGGVIPVSGPPTLELINSTYDDIFRARTVENQNADRLTKHAVELEVTLGPAVEGDWAAEGNRLRDALAILNGSEADEIKRIGREFQAKKDVNTEVRRAAEKDIDTATQGKVDALQDQIRELERQQMVLRAEVSAKKTDTATVENEANEVARAVGNAEAKEIRDANAPLRDSITTQIATADERSRGALVNETTRKNAEVARAGADAHKASSKAMSGALERLSSLKASVAGRMKIPAVTIASPRAGMPVDLCREENGALVPFSIWNDADADQFCLKLAILYRGPCGLVIVDNMRNWSGKRKAAIINTCRKYAKAEKMQFLLGQATDDGALKITDITEEAA